MQFLIEAENHGSDYPLCMSREGRVFDKQGEEY